MKKLKQSNNQQAEIAREMQVISSLINQGKYQDALMKIQTYAKENPKERTLQFNKSAFLIDIGSGLKDQSLVEQGINAGEGVLKTLKSDIHKDSIYYNLANGYLSLYELTERKTGIEAIPQSENLQKAKFHLREAIKLSDRFDSNLRKQIFVNYGNCLDILGRGVEALYSYDSALKMDSDFSMAIGNKAKALRFFADISGQYKWAIYLESYKAIKSILDKEDLVEIGGVTAKQAFERELKNIEARFKDKKILTKNIQHSKFSIDKLSVFEKFYIDFCIKEKLFLNFHLHHDHCEVAIADPIFISLITDTKDNDTFYRLAKYINQIKEDYAVARLLLVQSQFKRKDFDRISQRTTFVNTLDYAQFNLYVGLLKSSFKEAYNILDKIAVFINDYYKLGLPEDKIYFTSVWREKDIIRDEILQSKNISLYALYDIYQDFKSDECERIRDIRNALTHQKLAVFDSMITNWDKKDDKYNIGYDTMLDKTTELLRLAKSAIIYMERFSHFLCGEKAIGNGFN